MCDLVVTQIYDSFLSAAALHSHGTGRAGIITLNLKKRKLNTEKLKWIYPSLHRKPGLSSWSSYSRVMIFITTWPLSEQAFIMEETLICFLAMHFFPRQFSKEGNLLKFSKTEGPWLSSVVYILLKNSFILILREKYFTKKMEMESEL